MKFNYKYLLLPFIGLFEALKVIGIAIGLIIIIAYFMSGCGIMGLVWLFLNKYYIIGSILSLLNIGGIFYFNLDYLTDKYKLKE